MSQEFSANNSVYGAAIRMSAFALAVPMSLAFMNVCYKAPWVAREGRMTMQYYMFHALIIPPNSAPFIPPLIAIVTTMNIPMTFVTAVFIIAGTAALIALILKIPYFKMLTNPSSLLKQENKNK